ncbi:MAG: copper-binding protein [Bacteroidota bacterium]
MRLLALFLLAPALLTGCAEPDSPAAPRASFTVRGLYLGPAYDGTVAVISHEEIPGFMDAMQMPFRVEDAVRLDSLSEGDKIRFHLADRGRGYRIDSIRLLPPDTPLVLAGDTTDAAAPDTSSTPAPTD